MIKKNSYSPWKPHPNILEINTWIWLKELSAHYEKEISLDTLPEEIFEDYLAKFDAVWLMGIWERSPSSKKIAQDHLGLQKEFHEALEDFESKDIIGSPYAVYYYHVDSRLGGTNALEVFRQYLQMHDIKLILDYVPNHVSRDHLWTLETEDIFIKGTEEELQAYPNDYFKAFDKILAHGKDPNFPAWTDTVQIDAFSEIAREKAKNTIMLIAELCDGIRCDMAMLMNNEVFKRTWGEKAGAAPKKEFWDVIIPPVKERFPEFKFIGEVYWDMEWDMMQQGFDYCYDKRLYDRITDFNIAGIREHLKADFNFQKKLVRFLENHDEPRIASIMNPSQSRVAALLILTLPGMGLIHEGQMKGYRISIPVQLKRRIEESVNEELRSYYHLLLQTVKQNQIKKGKWELCTEEEQSSVIAYHWWSKETEGEFLIVVNMTDQHLKTNVKIPNLQIDSFNIKFEDQLNNDTSRYITDLIKKVGLLVELEAWEGKIYQISELAQISVQKTQ
ncbi:MAG: Alpha-amylase [Promethearchaeota archaeon]|nr:MAG: Alpha-amylase [Candidatus Lokiarchaeota archaeon]